MELPTITSILDFIVYAATPTGSGVLAMFIINWLKDLFPVTTQSFIEKLLNVPQLTQWFSLVLATGIGAVATYIVSVLTTVDLNPLIGGLASYAVSQFSYGFKKSSVIQE